MNNATLINQTSGREGFEYYTPEYIVDRWRYTLDDAIAHDPATTPIANSLFVRAEHIGVAPDFTDTVREDLFPEDAHEARGGLRPTAVLRTFHGQGSLDPAYSWAHRNFVINWPFGVGERACRPGCKKKTCMRRGWHTATALAGNNAWVARMRRAYESGETAVGLAIHFASTSEAWFRVLSDFPQAFIYRRVNYVEAWVEPVTGAIKWREVKGVTKGSVVTLLSRDHAVLDRFHEAFHDIARVHVPYELQRRVVGIPEGLPARDRTLSVLRPTAVPYEAGAEA